MYPPFSFNTLVSFPECDFSMGCCSMTLLVPTNTLNSPHSPGEYWLLSGYESEDLDYAIALSLSEEELKKPISTGTESIVDEDEQLARALQESLNTKSSPPKNRESPRICAGCENENCHGECLDFVWQLGCFRCFACGQPIIESDLPIYTYEDHLYHMSCYRNLYHPKCDVCKEFLTTDHQVLPVWMQKSCVSHQHDGTHYCFSCHRKEPHGANYSRFDNGQWICLECLDSLIMDTDECQPLYRDIQNFYKGLNMEIIQEIPLLLVERAVISSKSTIRKQGYPSPDKAAGVCHIDMEIVKTKLKWSKISIFILKGQPRILTGMYLSHEMMHAWLQLNGYRKLDSFVEEGICVVMSYMWLKFESKSDSGSNVASSSSSSMPTPYRKGQRSQFERKLAEYWKNNLKNLEYSIYRDGFQAGLDAVLKYDLKSVLDHIKLTGTFPC